MFIYRGGGTKNYWQYEVRASDMAKAHKNFFSIKKYHQLQSLSYFEKNKSD